VSVPLTPTKIFIKFSNQSNWLSINTTSESLLPCFYFRDKSLDNEIDFVLTVDNFFTSFRSMPVESYVKRNFPVHVAEFQLSEGILCI